MRHGSVSAWGRRWKTNSYLLQICPHHKHVQVLADDADTIHALSECDTVTYTYGKGKVSAVNFMLL